MLESNLLYRAALEYAGNTTPLYLAVPEAAYDGIFSEEIGLQVVAKAQILLMVFAPEREEIVQWLPHP
jgi:hypothetical protein